LGVFLAVSVFIFCRNRKKSKKQAYHMIHEHSSSAVNCTPVEPPSDVSPVSYVTLTVPVLNVPEAEVASEIPEATTVKARQ
jgi:hypothetical protein